MLFSADVIMGVLVVLLVARGLWDLFPGVTIRPVA
jgi:hypothetical protein